jgi:hypothetical protein
VPRMVPEVEYWGARVKSRPTQAARAVGRSAVWWPSLPMNPIMWVIMRDP